MMCLKISMIKIFFLFALMTSAFAVEKTPDHRHGIETGVDFRVLKKIRRYILLGESKNRKEITGVDYNQVLAGSYYRITKRFRMGGFFQAEQGLRWDEDWRKSGATWGWQNTNSRWDFSSVLDATYNDKLTRNLVWEMKTRLYYYHSRDALQLRLRPGLRYFIMREGKPLWQLFTEFEGYVPLTYGSLSLYEYWLYFGSLYQVTDKFSLGPVISFRERWFHAYDDFEKRSGESFKTHYQSIYLGLNVLYVF